MSVATGAVIAPPPPLVPLPTTSVPPPPTLQQLHNGGVTVNGNGLLNYPVPYHRSRAHAHLPQPRSFFPNGPPISPQHPQPPQQQHCTTPPLMSIQTGSGGRERGSPGGSIACRAWAAVGTNSRGNKNKGNNSNGSDGVSSAAAAHSQAAAAAAAAGAAAGGSGATPAKAKKKHGNGSPPNGKKGPRCQGIMCTDNWPTTPDHDVSPGLPNGDAYHNGGGGSVSDEYSNPAMSPMMGMESEASGMNGNGCTLTGRSVSMSSDKFPPPALVQARINHHGERIPYSPGPLTPATPFYDATVPPPPSPSSNNQGSSGGGGKGGSSWGSGGGDRGGQQRAKAAKGSKNNNNRLGPLSIPKMSSTSEIPDLATPLPISRLQLPHFQFNLIPNHHYQHQHHHNGGSDALHHHRAGHPQVLAAAAASDSVFD